MRKQKSSLHVEAYVVYISPKLTNYGSTLIKRKYLNTRTKTLLSSILPTLINEKWLSKKQTKQNKKTVM